MADRYGNTSTASYLHDRFGFRFSGAVEAQEIEDAIWEVAREAEAARRTAASIAETLATDSQYVLLSIQESKGAAYEPVERGGLAAAAREANAQERRLRVILAGAAAMRQGVANLRAEIGKGNAEATALTAELAETRARVSVLAQQRAEIEQKAMGAGDRMSLALQEAEQLRGALRDAQNEAANLRRDYGAVSAERESLRNIAQQLGEELQKAHRERDEAKRQADEFSDERDDAERLRKTAVDDYHGAVSDFQDVSAERDALRIQVRDLSEAVNEGEARYQASLSDVDKLTAEVDGLRRDLAEATRLAG